jgi:hypothetical protein
MYFQTLLLLLIASLSPPINVCRADEPVTSPASSVLLEAASDRLPNTAPLALDQPLDVHLVDGVRRFCLRQLEVPPARRDSPWNRPDLGLPALDDLLQAKRERFRAAIGAVDPRSTRDGEGDLGFELLESLERSSVVARLPGIVARAVRWQVLDGVTAEGLILIPDQIRAVVVAIPDADWTPEAFCGIVPGVATSARFPRQLAAAGCLVIVPTLISRDDQLSGHPRVGYTNLPHREYLYRQSFVVGRHVIGYEVQKVLAAVDLAERLRPRNIANSPAPTTIAHLRYPLGVAGVGEGGLLALYSAAIDPRVDACWVAGYFEERAGVWREPIYRNLWGLLAEFDDVELAGLIAPRRLTIEACACVEVVGPPPPRKDGEPAPPLGQSTLVRWPVFRRNSAESNPSTHAATLRRRRVYWSAAPTARGPQAHPPRMATFWKDWASS